MDIFARQKQDWIQEARIVAHKLLKRQYSITIEDVLTVHPLPKFLHPNTIGAVLNAYEFKRIGYEPARKESSHGRIISAWTEKLPGDYADKPERDLPRNYRKMRKTSTLEREE